MVWKRLSTVLLDFLLIQFGFILAFLARYHIHIADHTQNLEAYLEIAIFIMLIQIFLLHFYGLYNRSAYHDYLDILDGVVKAVSIGTMIVVFIAFFTRQFALPRSIVLLSWFFNLLLLSGWRWFRIYRHRGRLSSNRTLIYGTGKLAQLIANEIESRFSLGYEVVGFVADPGASQKIDRQLGRLDDLKDILKGNGIDEVIFAPDQRRDEELAEIVRRCETAAVNTKIAPGLFELITSKVHLEHFEDIPFIELQSNPTHNWYLGVKWVIDRILAAATLTLTAPLFALIALLIKLDSPGPVLFTQDRAGKDGKPFQLHKFRSMVADAEEQTGPVWASPGDERVTRVGRLLRKTSLDELPQLINVVKGEMSVIGPRPERPIFVEELKQKVPYYEYRMKIQPGMSGWAQVMHKYDESIDDVREKLQYDLYYIKNLSPLLDLRIMLRTIWKVLKAAGSN
ncbi:MAG: sugar transferase [Candidatus Bipolaricaulia bacterium]